MIIKYPCNICSKSVHRNHRAIQCDICDQWSHISCNFIDNKTYQKLKESDEEWYCIICNKTVYPFASSTDEDMKLTLQGKNCINNTLSIDLSTENKTIINQLNKTDENSVNYFTPSELNKHIEKSKTTLSYFHMNISSLPYHIDGLKTLLASINIDFDIIAISESRLKRSFALKTNIGIEKL